MIWMRRRVKGRSVAQIWQLQFFGHPPSLPLSLLYVCPCPSPVTKQDALNYTRTLPSPFFLQPLLLFYPFL